MRSSRLSSFLAWSSASCGMPAFSIASRSSSDLGRLLVALTQLLLNVAQLLAQNMLALLGGQRLLGLIADLLRDLEHFDALHEQREHLVQPLLDVDRLEHVLLFRRLGVEDAGNEIGERGRRDPGCSIVAATSAGTFGNSWMTSWARPFTRRTRASMSGVMTSAMPISSMRATRNGNPVRYSMTRNRRTPWAITWCVPSGAVT